MIDQPALTRGTLVSIVLAFLALPFVFAVPYLAVDDYGRAKFDLPRRPDRMPVPRTKDKLANRRAMDLRIEKFEAWIPRQLMDGVMFWGVLALVLGLPILNVGLALRSTKNPVVAVLRGVRWFFGGWFIFGWMALPTIVGQAMLDGKPVGSFARWLGYSP